MSCDWDASGRPTILVVDDSSEVRKATLRLLKVAGYDAIGVADGGEGLKKAQQLRPAVIVTDLVMPVLNGIELAQSLARTPSVQHTPVILFSASIDSSPIPPDLFRAVLSKPFDSAGLLKAIADALRSPR